IPFLLNFGSIGLAVIVSYVTFVANFRTKILSLLFVLGSYLIMFKRKTFYSSSIYLVIGIILVGIVSSRFSINSESFIDRFNLNDNEQTQTITSRQKQIGFGLELGKKLFGVGLGNYYDYVPAKNKTPRGSIDKNTQIQLTEVNDSIHNNFASVLAECGYPTLLIYVLMITYFLLKDIRILFEKNRKDRKLFILSFWGLFIYGFFNPGVALSYQFQYWFYRGIISNENIN
ncbi:MAG: O-antigen ligase family protein, partial [Candidatus Taylorbacteria bacterium]|nr:O-antigen ligase family protein [Candidatus Taylorbacteria bacterium]